MILRLPRAVHPLVLSALAATSLAGSELPLTAGSEVEGVIRPGEAHHFRLVPPPGTTYEVRLRDPDDGILVTVLDESGESRTIDGAGFCPQRATLTSGEHRLSVSLSGGDPHSDPISYEIVTIERPSDPRDPLRARAEGGFGEAVRIYRASRSRDTDSRERASRLLDPAIETWRELDEPCRLASALWVRANMTEDPVPSAELAREAVAIFDRLENRRGQAWGRDLLGVRLMFQGRIDEASEVLERAVELAGETEDPKILADVLHNLGSLRRNQKRDQEALDLHHRSMEVARRAGYEEKMASEATALAGILLGLGEYDEAKRQLQTGLEIATRLGDIRRLGWIERNLGRVYRDLGDMDRAREHFERSIAHRREVGDSRGEAVVHHDLGILLQEIGELEQARISVQRAHDIAASIGDSMGRAVTLSTLGSLDLDRGRPLDAREKFQETHALRAERGFGLDFAELHLAQASLALGELGRAQTEVEAGLAVLERRREELRDPEQRAGWFGRRRTILETYVEVLLQRHERAPDADFSALAFAASERARARSLLDLLGGDPESLERGLLGLEAARSLVPENGLLLEYLVGAEGSYLFALDPDGLDVHRLPSRDWLEGRVREYRRLLQKPGRRTAVRRAELGKELSAALLGPVAATAGRAGRLLVIPDGPLHLLPFDALPADESRRPAIERWILETAPSVSILGAIRDRANDRSPIDSRPQLELVAFADPGRSTTGSPSIGDPEVVLRSLEGENRHAMLPSLPGARREISAIGSGFSPENIRLFVGDDATEARAREPEVGRARRLHFATHALVSEADPEASALVLAPGDGETDGLLRVPEVAELDLDADLVVLSACETALGREVLGEGLLGFTQAFLTAGARQLVLTLWQVPDTSTAELMSRFYRELSESDPGAALRRAKLSLIESGYSDPYYWAPFVVIGSTSIGQRALPPGSGSQSGVE